MVAAGGFLIEDIYLFFAKTRVLGGLLAKAKDHEGIAVLARQLNPDVGVFRSHYLCVNVGDKAGHDVGVKTSQSWMI